MGSGITMTCADAGLPVRILEMNEGRLRWQWTVSAAPMKCR